MTDKPNHNPSGEDKRGTPVEGAQDFVNMFNKGADFLREVVEENQRLRFKVASLEEKETTVISDPDNPDERIAALSKELEAWKTKYNSLMSRIEEVEDENKDFLKRYMEVEEENNNLANLYIASYQLHSTLSFQEVLQIILEIIINLIGAETFAIYLAGSKDDGLQAAASEGIEINELPNLKSREGEIGESVAKAEMLLFEERLTAQKIDMEKPIAIIPLQIKEDTIGAIVIYKLLSQKSKFLDVDRELFHLLAGHAATAIFASKLYTESERKLSTMQGFIDLLTK